MVSLWKLVAVTACGTAGAAPGRHKSPRHAAQLLPDDAAEGGSVIYQDREPLEVRVQKMAKASQEAKDENTEALSLNMGVGTEWVDRISIQNLAKQTGCSPFADNVPIFVLGVESERETANARFKKILNNMCFYFIPAYLEADIVPRLEGRKQAGIVAKEGYIEDDNHRTGLLGLVADGKPQNSFTVACSATHRRVWQSLVEHNTRVGMNGGSLWNAAVVFEADAEFIPRGKSQTPWQALALSLKSVVEYNRDWGVVNIGRCWDYCELQKDLAYIADSNQTLVRSMRPLCTHAYMVSSHGAKSLLAYSLPHVTSVDQYITMVGRMHLTPVYALANSQWTQARAAGGDAHDHTGSGPVLPECDVNGGFHAFAQAFEPLIKNSSAPDASTWALWRDAFALQIINSHWITKWSAVAESCPAEHSNACSAQDMQSVKDQCKKFAKSQNMPPPEMHRADLNAIYEKMKNMDLKGVVLYGLNPNDMHFHTHSFIHQAIYESWERIFSYAPDDGYHLCWLNSTTYKPGCSVGQALNHENPSPLGQSFVFASPKHMTWTDDPVLENLQADYRSRYVVHELVPPHLQQLKRGGKLVEWFVWGPDGSDPDLESKDFAMRYFDRETTEPSMCDQMCNVPAKRLFVGPWATSAQTDDQSLVGTSEMYQASNDTVQFIGSIWHENVGAFCEFAESCKRAQVHLVHHGSVMMDNGATKPPCADGNEFLEIDPASTKNVPAAKLTDAEANILVKESMFAVAFQGDEHIPDAQHAYIADRPLTAMALGQTVASNNPGLSHLLGAYNRSLVIAPVNQLCEAAAKAIRSGRIDSTARKHGQYIVLKNHTYITRMKDLLTTLNGANSAAWPEPPPLSQPDAAACHVWKGLSKLAKQEGSWWSCWHSKECLHTMIPSLPIYNKQKRG